MFKNLNVCLQWTDILDCLVLTGGGGRIVFRYDVEEVLIESWGHNAIHVPAIKMCSISSKHWNLRYAVEASTSKFTIERPDCSLFSWLWLLMNFVANKRC